MTEPTDLPDDELEQLASHWRRCALHGDLHARGTAHQLEAALRRRNGAIFPAFDTLEMRSLQSRLEMDHSMAILAAPPKCSRSHCEARPSFRASVLGVWRNMTAQRKVTRDTQHQGNVNLAGITRKEIVVAERANYPSSVVQHRDA